MTAWGDGVPAAGAPPQAGPPPRRNDDTRVVVLVVMFTTAIVLVGIGAFLIGRGPDADSGVSGPTSLLDAPMVTPTAAPTDTTPALSTTAAPSTVAPTTIAATTTDVATTVASTTATSTTAPSTTVALALVDNSARAQGDLEVHFANHDRVDLDAAYAGLSESFAPPFDEFVTFWGTDVASVDSPIDDCTVTGNTGTCRVRFFITYSDAAADESLRGTCSGQLVELTMRETNGRFLIDGQRDIESLTCR